MKFTKTFKELSKNDADIAGGKGASLGEMTKAGIPVPPGFVVLASSFDRFLEETDLNVEVDAAFDAVNPDDINSVEEASKKIQDMIHDADFPEDIGSDVLAQFKKLNAPLVAVRSSATAEDSSIASWAGELDSYLNVTEEHVLDYVKQCWASLFTPRAIFYRHEKNMHDMKVSVAVVVQAMITSEVSGITFTVHPVTEDTNQMVIEAGWGLGEAIVGGMITPDTYVVTKDDRTILDANISQQSKMIVRDESGTTKEVAVPKSKEEVQKITNQQIIEIGDICMNIEKHYGFPCDIEWAFQDNSFYIVQSRPITTLQ